MKLINLSKASSRILSDVTYYMLIHCRHSHVDVANWRAYRNKLEKVYEHVISCVRKLFQTISRAYVSR